MEWKTISTKNVYTNPWINVREDAIVHPSGKKGIYGVVEVPPGIFAVALNEQDEVLLVRQHRYPTDMTSWELPGGGLKKGSSPEKQIEEELVEEAHMQARSFDLLGKTQTQPGVTTEVDCFFVAKGLSPVANAPVETMHEEGIDQARFFSLNDVLDMIRSGDVSHGQTITGLMLYLSRDPKKAWKN